MWDKLTEKIQEVGRNKMLETQWIYLKNLWNYSKTWQFQWTD